MIVGNGLLIYKTLVHLKLTFSIPSKETSSIEQQRYKKIVRNFYRLAYGQISGILPSTARLIGVKPQNKISLSDPVF
jgi:hypothetical protein